MSNEHPKDNGIGIIKFLKHKNFFITGSTGFIAKVFIEKLLREVPEVQKVYLLMRAKNEEAATQRVNSEIIDCELFKRPKEMHGGKYEEFMKSKLVPVVGNICDPCLGMYSDVAAVIADQVDSIINTAGNTKWHERYDELLEVNVKGLSILLDYAMNCRKLILFLHVSTAAAAFNRDTIGVVMENPIAMKESTTSNVSMPTTLDIETELKMATKLASEIPNHKLSIEMAKLGYRRAKLHGCLNTYQLTKAMGEMLITKLEGKLSTVIIRPTLVESSIKEPFPGWIEGYRVMDPMILSYGRGQLQGIFADPESILDLVPVDAVVNTMIAAIANHETMGKSRLNIYHVASSMVNPLICHKFLEYACKYFTLHPLKSPRGEMIIVKDMEFFTSIDEYILFGLDSKSSNHKLHCKLTRMAIIYQGAMFYKLRFDNKNTQILYEKMPREEKKIFDFDVKNIIWEEYFYRIFISVALENTFSKKSLSPQNFRLRRYVLMMVIAYLVLAYEFLPFI